MSVPSSPETDTDLLALAETLEQWVEAIRAPNNAELTLVDMAYLNGECVSDSIELAVKALRRHAQQTRQDIERILSKHFYNGEPGDRESIKDATAALVERQESPGAALAEPTTVAADLDSGDVRPNRELDSPDRVHTRHAQCAGDPPPSSLYSYPNDEYDSAVEEVSALRATISLMRGMLHAAPAQSTRVAVIEECAKVAEAQAHEFLSPKYASNQPFGSTCERFACEQVAKAIRALSVTSTDRVGSNEAAIKIVDGWTGEVLKRGFASSWHYGELLTALYALTSTEAQGFDAHDDFFAEALSVASTERVETGPVTVNEYEDAVAVTSTVQHPIKNKEGGA